MYQPEAYGIALFMIISMLCWGSWANTKLIPAMFIFFLLGLGSIVIAPMVQ